MIRAGVVLGLARAEARLTRRLVRYWVFQAIALILGVGIVLYYGFLHRMFSSWSGTAALLNPRYLVAFIGIYYLVGFLLGLVFLGYDVRARDRRERIIEVVDALPFTNLELMVGRFLGILIPSWVPVVVICGILWLVAKLMGGGLAVSTLLTFAFFLVVPAYCFVLGLTFLLTILLRHRLLAAVTLIAAIVGLIVVNFGFVPIFVLPLVDLTGGFSVPAVSDLTPSVIDLRGFLQRMAFLFAGLSMLWFSAAAHPRKDDSSRGVIVAAGAAMLVLAFALAGFLVLEGRNAIDRNVAWKAAHDALRDEPSPDVRTISGEVRLDPGRSLDMDLQLEIAAPPGDDLERALFTLNPGLEIRSVVAASGADLTWEQHDGLADVRLDSRLQAGQTTTLRMQIQGRPNTWFAYLDSAFDPLDISIQEGNIFILGFKSAIFTRDYNVLLPGIRWLPASGADVGRGDPHGRPLDFFDVDLTVEIPEGMLVAGPGRRRPAEGAAAGNVRYRFAPPAPMPGVALVVGRMESRSTEIEGVTLEVLVHPSHTQNLEFFDDAAGEIHDWLSERLAEAAEVGLSYPYDGLTMVEVPADLRGYAGGWRMDTTFTQPSMVFMREAGFPTARFDVPFKDPEEFRDHEGGIQRAKREWLERFFENDFSGGNPFIAAARSFFSYQTAGTGSIALPMDYICEDLSTRLVAEKQGYFSIHHYGRDMGTTINETIGAMFQDRGSKISDALIDAVTSRSEVWDQVLEVSLEELDPWEEPKRALDVLTLKGGAMSRSMLDELGHEKTGQVLAALRASSSGAAYTREDIVAAGDEVGVDLSSWLDVWIGQTELPGFTVGKVAYERISDSEDGAPRYQLLLTLQNEEPTPGLVRVEYRVGEPDQRRSEPETAEPVRVPGNGAVEIGVVTSKPLRVMRVVPYLALNRIPFNVDLPALDEQTIVDAEPFIGSREIEWTPPEGLAIIVDDLDPGFAVEEAESRSWFRFGGRGVRDEDTDQGLPIAQFGRPPTRWSRRTYPTAFGKYRHTVAQVRAGKGERLAMFSVEIPRAGSWELEYYLPPARSGGTGLGRGRRGTWSLTVTDPSGSHDITFDADDGEPGWNSLGTFEIADGETKVVISDKSEGGRLVLADAIRWTPQRPEAEGVAHR